MWERKRRAASASRSTTPGGSGSRRTRTASTSEPYVIVGLLAERRFGRFRLFINGENLTGVRQIRVGSDRCGPPQAVDGRWTVDAWAPLEGRVINGGLRIRF